METIIFEELDNTYRDIDSLYLSIEEAILDSSTLLKIRTSIEKSNQLSNTTRNLSNIAIEKISNNLGIVNYKLLPSLEDNSNNEIVKNIAIENISEMLTKIWNAIKSAFLKLWDMVKKLYEHIKNSFGSLEKKNNELRIKLNEKTKDGEKVSLEYISAEKLKAKYVNIFLLNKTFDHKDVEVVLLNHLKLLENCLQSFSSYNEIIKNLKNETKQLTNELDVSNKDNSDADKSLHNYSKVFVELPKEIDKIISIILPIKNNSRSTKDNLEIDRSSDILIQGTAFHVITTKHDDPTEPYKMHSFTSTLKPKEVKDEFIKPDNGSNLHKICDINEDLISKEKDFSNNRILHNIEDEFNRIISEVVIIVERLSRTDRRDSSKEIDNINILKSYVLALKQVFYIVNLKAPVIGVKAIKYSLEYIEDNIK